VSPRDRPDLARTLGLTLLAALLVVLVRGRLFEQNRLVQEETDLYALPPPREVALLSLGYRAALADLLWAHLLVSQGLHTQAKRRYENIPALLDTINELEPTFRDPYRLADALITFNAKETPAAEARKAREIMERGVKNCPLDGELWLGLGEFVAFIAPGSYLTDPDEVQRWRVDGARMLARASELSGGQSYIAWQALGGARFLGGNGERDAEIKFLERTLVVTDDEELKDKIRARLSMLVGSKREQERNDMMERLHLGVLAVRHLDVPYVTRLRYVVLGPARDPAWCAGPDHALDPACASTFREWQDRTEEARAGGL
jgi:hypothetical protein